MPRKSPGHDSRMITYGTFPGSTTRYQRVNAVKCTAWVQTNLPPPRQPIGSGGDSKITHLGADGKYVVADASHFLSLRSEEVTQWLRDADSMRRRRGCGLSGIGLGRS
jgi:hypothetical protein